MLEKEDLKLIKQVVQEVIKEDVFPHFVDIYERFDGVDQRFDGVDQRFDRVEQRLSNIEMNMVTKDYLESRLVDFKVTLKESGSRALQQVKKMAVVLHKNGTITGEQVVHITSA